MYQIQEIDTQTLSRWLQEKREMLLLDVRTPGEIFRGIIPSGKALPLNQLPDQADGLPRDKTIVFYCRTGARSAQACAFMAARGHGNVHNLQGGIIDWARHGEQIAAPSDETFAGGAGAGRSRFVWF